MGFARIGHVDVKSGILVICDFGLLSAFSEEPKAAQNAAHAAVAKGATEMDHAGVEAVVVGNLPAGRYTIYSDPLVDDELEGMRRAVIIEFREGVKAARSIDLGSVPVDMARLGVMDVQALTAWNETSPADGKADIVFWGLHEDEVAKRFNAPKVDDDSFGFVDLPVKEAIGIAERLQALREGGELRFAFDFRPHTHPYFLLSQIRSSESESGVIDVGGFDVCGFMTTWGDGVFPVTLEVDAEGKPLRCTIVLATDDAMENMREVNQGEDEEDGDEDESDEDDSDNGNDQGTIQ
jgi:hypothetical protein